MRRITLPATTTQPSSRRRRLALSMTALAFVLAAAVGAQSLQQAPAYEKSGDGISVLTAPSGLAIKILVEASNLGSGEVELAEISFPGGSQGSSHRHGAIEILYVLSGRMDHVVNGVSHVLEPGMIGIVRPEDTVAHRILSSEPVRAVVVWAPGGEAARLRGVFAERPAER